MAIGTSHRSNNYSESKRNDHLDNNRRQEQRNKGIPNKSHPNFREEHKSFSSIFVSNIPWNASVQDLWDICNKWGVLVSNLRTAWMGGFHLFADVAKYGRTYNRPVERSGDGKPSVGKQISDMSGQLRYNSKLEQNLWWCRIVTRASRNICLLRDFDDCWSLDMLGRLGLVGIRL
ncbi:nucleotide-binding alpha-beta plait domain-containing protein [Tanacetum coccineum]